jgi:hypothetical protein
MKKERKKQTNKEVIKTVRNKEVIKKERNKLVIKKERNKKPDLLFFLPSFLFSPDFESSLESSPDELSPSELSSSLSNVLPPSSC